MSTTAGPPAAVSARRDREAVAVRELHVEQHGVGRLGGDRREGFRRVGRFAGDDVPGALQELARDRAKRLMVVDDQHSLHHSAIVAHGSSAAAQGFPWNRAISVESPAGSGMMSRVDTASPPARDSSQRRFPDRGHRGLRRRRDRRLRSAGDARLRREGDDARSDGHAAGAGAPRSGDRRPGCALGRAQRRPAETGRRPAAPPPRPRHRGSGADRVPGWGGLSPGARAGDRLDRLSPARRLRGLGRAGSSRMAQRRRAVRVAGSTGRSTRPSSAATSCGRSRYDPGRCCGSTRGRSRRPRRRFDSRPAARWGWPPAVATSG